MQLNLAPRQSERQRKAGKGESLPLDLRPGMVCKSVVLVKPI